MKVEELFIDRIFTISNVLSFVRIFSVPIFGYMIYYGYYHPECSYCSYYQFAMFFALSFTDFLDGFLARALNQVTRLGRFLDPMADKITSISTGFLLYVYKDYPLWIVLFVVFREVVVIFVSFFLFSKRDVEVKPNIFGKMSVGFFAISAMVYILNLNSNLKFISILLIVFFYILGGIKYIHTYSGYYGKER